jgi:hypothetical protein
MTHLNGPPDAANNAQPIGAGPSPSVDELLLLMSTDDIRLLETAAAAEGISVGRLVRAAVSDLITTLNSGVPITGRRVSHFAGVGINAASGVKDAD